jgi:uncharacterized protein (DUF1810 family)
MNPNPGNDPYNLLRFVAAQGDAQSSIYESACAELRRGRKTGHWIWFIFPQLHGLGSSAISKTYAISSLKEAAAFAAHPILGPRLREVTRIVNAIEGRSIHEIFGYPDDLKFHSSMTLFARATTDISEFQAALVKYFNGAPDKRTVEMLA